MAKLFRSVIGLPQASWGENTHNLIRERYFKQSTLADFLDRKKSKGFRATSLLIEEAHNTDK